MSGRSKSDTAKGSAPGPTASEQKTAMIDGGKRARQAARGEFPPEVDPTVVDGPLARSVDASEPLPGGPTFVDGPNAGPTMIDTPRPPIVAVSKKDPPGKIQAISMKTPGQGLPAPDANPPTPVLPRPQLRGVAEVASHGKSTGPVQNLGNLAQPYDPKQARARAMREYVIWGCLAVILASGVALVVWFVAQ